MLDAPSIVLCSKLCRHNVSDLREPHPFHVKSTWMPQVQHSVARESYLENVKTQLAEIKITTKPKNNLSRNEVKALKELKSNPAINLKKADKGTTTVIMNKAKATAIILKHKYLAPLWLFTYEH